MVLNLLVNHTNWWESSEYIASDNSRPTIISDFEKGRYAIPMFGPEIIPNGNFDSGTTGWSFGSGTIQVVNGELEITGNGTGFAQAFAPVTLTPGKQYVLTATARKGTANGNAVVRMGFSNSAAVSNSTTTNVTGTQYFTAVRENEFVLAIISNVASTGTMYVDNISLREVFIGEVGAEIVKNGGFSQAATGDPATGWQLQTFGGTGTATISGGLLNLTGDGSIAAAADQSLTTEIGKSYTLIFNSSTQVNVAIGTSQGGTQVALISNVSGWPVISFVATATTTWLRLARVAASLATVDNVSLRMWYPTPKLRSASFSEVFAFSTSNTSQRTFIGPDGSIQNDPGLNQPRFDYLNNTRALLLENTATNLLLNSNSLATQSVTVSATAHTLSFYGTGTITLSGTSSAGPLVGTGENSRVSLTFTPTAGTLTLTVSGTVTNAQLEAQSFMTSYIPTTTSSVGRLIESARFSPLVESILSRPAFTGLVQGQLSNFSTAARAIIGNDNSGTLLFATQSNQNLVSNWNGAVGLNAVLGSGTFTTTSFGVVLAFDSTGKRVCGNGGVVASDNTQVGNKAVTYLARSPGSSTYGDGRYKRMVFYSNLCQNSAIQAMAVGLPI